VKTGYQILVEPKIRFGHTAVVFKNLMYVFGGWDGNVTLSDINVYEFESNSWY
jgi:N-acetylneuraminic acid mutarotase